MNFLVTSFLCLFLCVVAIGGGILDFRYDLSLDDGIFDRTGSIISGGGDAFETHEKNGLNGRKGLQEFHPVSNTIIQGETQTYSFSVNKSSGVGEYYQFLIFIAGNICSEPDNLKDGDEGLQLHYGFNSTMFSDLLNGLSVGFHNGYAQALAKAPIDDSNSNITILYIAVTAPENTNKSALWSYQVGVSQNDLVFQWDDRSFASVVDTDDDSALIVTGNLTGLNNVNYSHINATYSKYSLYVYSYDYKDYFSLLNSSWCAIRQGPALLSSSKFESSFTNRGGGLKQQFYIPGLNSSSKYWAYLVFDFDGSEMGGAVFQPFEFETLNESTCELIYGLEFCDMVAYSVPRSESLDKKELIKKYDEQASAQYVNFSKAMQQIACETTDEAVFSPIRTCADCERSYKEWLCSVTIPRCSTRNVSGYQYRQVDSSRNTFINDVIKPKAPYYEIMPCVNVCYAIVKDCPADLKFACPTQNKTIQLSYYWDEDEGFPTCNYVGKPKIASSLAIKQFILNWWLVLFIPVLYIL